MELHLSFRSCKSLMNRIDHHSVCQKLLAGGDADGGENVQYKLYNFGQTHLKEINCIMMATICTGVRTPKCTF